MKEFKLCYIDGNCAYFTTQKLEDQWGDDWNDVPYEHNAGEPYGPFKKDEDWEIEKVYFESKHITPDYYHYNSPYSVEMINNGCVPWLSSPSYLEISLKSIYAGTNIEDFIKTIKKDGGKVYLEI